MPHKILLATAVVISGWWVSSPAAADAVESGYNPLTIAEMVVAVGRATDISPYALGALVLHESNWGQNVGAVGGAVANASWKDAACAYKFAEWAGVNPFELPGGGVGEIGVSQFRCSTFAELSGVTFSHTVKHLFSSRERMTSKGVKVMQMILNATVARSQPLVVDGMFGDKTAEALRAYQAREILPHVSEGLCLREVRRGRFGNCTKTHMLWTYAPSIFSDIWVDRKADNAVDRYINRVPEYRGANPRGLTASLVASALYLKGFGAQKDLRYALGCYNAGAYGMQNGSRKTGLNYADQVIRKMARIQRYLVRHNLL